METVDDFLDPPEFCFSPKQQLETRSVPDWDPSWVPPPNFDEVNEEDIVPLPQEDEITPHNEINEALNQGIDIPLDDTQAPVPPTHTHPNPNQNAWQYQRAYAPPPMGYYPNPYPPMVPPNPYPVWPPPVVLPGYPCMNPFPRYPGPPPHPALLASHLAQKATANTKSNDGKSAANKGKTDATSQFYNNLMDSYVDKLCGNLIPTKKEVLWTKDDEATYTSNEELMNVSLSYTKQSEKSQAGKSRRKQSDSRPHRRRKRKHVQPETVQPPPLPPPPISMRSVHSHSSSSVTSTRPFVGPNDSNTLSNTWSDVPPPIAPPKPRKRKQKNSSPTQEVPPLNRMNTDSLPKTEKNMLQLPKKTLEVNKSNEDAKVVEQSERKEVEETSDEEDENGRCRLPDRALVVLREWFQNNVRYPYPKQSDKERLAAETNLSVKQVNTWFTNTRKRVWQPCVDNLRKKQEHRRRYELLGHEQNARFTYNENIDANILYQLDKCKLFPQSQSQMLLNAINKSVNAKTEVIEIDCDSDQENEEKESENSATNTTTLNLPPILFDVKSKSKKSDKGNHETTTPTTQEMPAIVPPVPPIPPYMSDVSDDTPNAALPPEAPPLHMSPSSSTPVTQSHSHVIQAEGNVPMDVTLPSNELPYIQAPFMEEEEDEEPDPNNPESYLHPPHPRGVNPVRTNSATANNSGNLGVNPVAAHMNPIIPAITPPVFRYPPAPLNMAIQMNMTLNDLESGNGKKRSYDEAFLQQTYNNTVRSLAELYAIPSNLRPRARKRQRIFPNNEDLMPSSNASADGSETEALETSSNGNEPNVAQIMNLHYSTT